MTSALLNAVNEGNTDEVRRLLQEPPVRTAYDNNDKIMRSACKKGDDEIVQMLLDNGFDPTCSNNEPFILACEYGHVTVVRMLLEDGRVDPFARDNRAFLSAAKNGNLRVLQALAERVDLINNAELRARALKCGEEDVAKFLLAYVPGTRLA